MARDYLLFIHGVNVRETLENEAREKYTYADNLFELINREVKQKEPDRECVSVPLYWGDVNRVALNELLSNLERASTWDKIWFQELRKGPLFQFVGDAALYISRLIGAIAAEQLGRQAFKQLADYEPDDRLHLITHSWGAVVLFDILFASRWDEPPDSENGQTNVGYESVQAIREKIYGIGKNPDNGIRLESIQTMGSPIPLFSLITISGKDVNNRSTHDISPGLACLLKKLVQGEKKLSWLNFIHPGDPIAWPLETLIGQVIVGAEKYLQVEDILTRGSSPWEYIAQMPIIRQTPLALVNGGSAHGSYWQNKDIAKRIAAQIVD